MIIDKIETLTPKFATRWRCKLSHRIVHRRSTIPKHYFHDVVLKLREGGPYLRECPNDVPLRRFLGPHPELRSPSAGRSECVRHREPGLPALVPAEAGLGALALHHRSALGAHLRHKRHRQLVGGRRLHQVPSPEEPSQHLDREPGRQRPPQRPPAPHGCLLRLPGQLELRKGRLRGVRRPVRAVRPRVHRDADRHRRGTLPGHLGEALARHRPLHALQGEGHHRGRLALLPSPGPAPRRPGLGRIRPRWVPHQLLLRLPVTHARQQGLLLLPLQLRILPAHPPHR
ncbi:hypothetical protein AVEN_248811-1 [Araneus ventricosus]|uniref:Uncharacterized protein n=1 Tax=Araneus ventricosus TaxID=182803 RepID=A0A4Y2J623_ARAVE|nr:hypothetical protein AVEN_248811-1 [Araneus ventricosus]